MTPSSRLHVQIQGYKLRLPRSYLLEYSQTHAPQLLAFQFVNPQAIYSATHLHVALSRALRRYLEKRTIARDLGVELLLWITGQHQISTALKLAGLPNQEEISEAVLILVGTSEDECTSELRLFDQRTREKGYWIQPVPLEELSCLTEKEVQERYNLQAEHVSLIGTNNALLEKTLLLELK